MENAKCLKLHLPNFQSSRNLLRAMLLSEKHSWARNNIINEQYYDTLYYGCGWTKNTVIKILN
jgi:hypothetical protein